MPARTLRSVCALLLLVAALLFSSCYSTATEIVTTADSIRLAGLRFVTKDGAKTMTYEWVEPRKGYLDAEATALIQFGRLKGDAYIAQIHALKSETPDGQMAPIDNGVFVVMQVAVTSTLTEVDPDCHEDSMETEWKVRGFGAELDPRSNALTGPRAAIIGFLATRVACEAGLRDVIFTPESIHTGGRELALDGTQFDRARFVDVFRQRCEAGEVESCYVLGQKYQTGDSVTRDSGRAATLFEKACAADEPRACEDLAMLLDRGEGVPRDTARALQLFRKACDGGGAYACAMLKGRGGNDH